MIRQAASSQWQEIVFAIVITARITLSRCACVCVSTKTKTHDRNDLKLGTVLLVVDRWSTLIDFGFEKSRVTATGSASLCIYGLLPNPQ